MDKAYIRVLVVDDQVNFITLVSEVLEGLGYLQIKKAERGSEALDLAKEYMPNLVLMGTYMPEITGPEVCMQMRQEDYVKNAGIIGMSMENNPELERAWLEAGADDFIEKRWLVSDGDRNDLDARIQKALAKHRNS